MSKSKVRIPKPDTTTTELAELASRAKTTPANSLPCFHCLAARCRHPAVKTERIAQRMMSRYSGHVVVGRDPDVY